MKRVFYLVLASSAAFAQAPQTPPQPPPAAPAATAPARADGLYAHFKTSQGEIVARLFEKETPIAVRNFVGLAQGTKPWLDPKTKTMVHRPLYNNVLFHRVMRDAMIQSGDPTGRGDHNCGFTIRDEILPGLKFSQAGRLAVANIGKPDSGACQWFITATAPVTQWDGQYTIFGQVVEGLDVVKTISRVPVDKNLRPTNPPVLISVTIERVGPEPPQPVKKTPGKKPGATAKR